MQVKELYNEAYKKFTPDFINPQNMAQIEQYLKANSDSLMNFLKEYRIQFDSELDMAKSSCLEYGCGIGAASFELEKMFFSVSSLDISELAIAAAKQIGSMKTSKAHFIVADACYYQSSASFDYIVDSHLLHCLSDERDRQQYLKNIQGNLKKTGKVFLETMVFSPKLEFPIEYFYDENKTLWKGEVPIRKIKTSREIEGELISAGLKIEYLYYHSELSFCPFDEYPHFPSTALPKVLRICATLA